MHIINTQQSVNCRHPSSFAAFAINKLYFCSVRCLLIISLLWLQLFTSFNSEAKSPVAVPSTSTEGKWVIKKQTHDFQSLAEHNRLVQRLKTITQNNSAQLKKYIGGPVVATHFAAPVLEPHSNVTVLPCYTSVGLLLLFPYHYFW